MRIHIKFSGAPSILLLVNTILNICNGHFFLFICFQNFLKSEGHQGNEMHTCLHYSVTTQPHTILHEK